MLYSRALGDTLRQLLGSDPRVVVMGEDIEDPYGGAFKVTRGLSSDFPERVLTTPVSEQAITGLAAGLAMSGYRPIVEYMFGDFVGLGFDQIVNHVTKYRDMYDAGVTCPVVLRVPSGGGRGYGPTHSQSLEKHFLGTPNLRIVSASLYHHPEDAFASFLADDEPVMFVEHKLLYPRRMAPVQGGALGDLLARNDGSPGRLPTLRLSAVPAAECNVSVVAYGFQAVRVAERIEELAVEEEIFVELLVPQDLAPIDYAPLEDSVNATGALVTFEEGTAHWAWGSEVAAQIHRRCFGKLRHPVEVLTSKSAIIPSAKSLEDEMLVCTDALVRHLREVSR